MTSTFSRRRWRPTRRPVSSRRRRPRTRRTWPDQLYASIEQYLQTAPHAARPRLRAALAVIRRYRHRTGRRPFTSCVRDLVAQQLGPGREQEARRAIDLCVSPIEEALLAGLVVVGLAEGRAVRLGAVAQRQRPNTLVIEPQAPVGPYRVDFLVTSHAASVAVECDGYRFHDSSPERRLLDRVRDRRLVALGCAVLRFSGCEVWQYAIQSGHEALGTIDGGASLARCAAVR